MDSAFLKKVLEGDVQAYKYFVDKYGDMAYTVAVSIVRNPHEAEEVVQDVIMRWDLFNNVQNFQRGCTKSW